MTISVLYNKLLSNPGKFLQVIGVEKNTFDSLLSHFQVRIPMKLTMAERLCAALYAEHNALDAGATGLLLEYTNACRDGRSFLTQSKSALIIARSKMPAPKPINTTPSIEALIIARNNMPAPKPINIPVSIEAPVSARSQMPAPEPVKSTVSIAAPAVKKPAIATETAKKRPVYGCPMHAAIAISYRNEQGRSMHGAFYDHYTMRHITQHETNILKPPEQGIDTFLAFIHTTTFALGLQDAHGERIIPAVKSIANQSSGLLVIPGHASGDTDIVRKEHEQRLIQQARRRGQPILAICAGSWRLWEAYGGVTKAVSGHLYSQMPYVITNGGIGNNKQIHRITLEADTLLAKAMQVKNRSLSERPTVNSVHWKSPDSQTTPSSLVVSATAIPDEDLHPRNRNGDMSPEAEVEAFEAKNGAPVLGIQWHPEAYYKNQDADNESERHLNVIRYMAKAGDAYQAKRRMMDEFNGKKVQLLSKFGIFRSTEDAPVESHAPNSEGPAATI